MMSERRKYRSYPELLPEYYPIKLIGAFISLDFIVGCSFNCSFCISRRHPSREELFDKKVVINNRVSPRKMLSWLTSMPSYQAGVQVRIGHDTDAGLQFAKSSQLIAAADSDKSFVYLTRKPFSDEERAFFSRSRNNLLVKVTLTPRSRQLGYTMNPFKVISSTQGIPSDMLYWVVGPLVSDSYADTMEIIDALPPSASLFLKKLNTNGLPALNSTRPMDEKDYESLVKRATDRGLKVTEWFCSSLARIGKGFFDVDKITGQPASAKRERELSYCGDCPSFSICHAELNESAVVDELLESMDRLGLTPLSLPKRTAKRSFHVEVREPSSRGDETYLSQMPSSPVRVTLNTREAGISQGGCFCNVERDVIRRWYERSFIPASELNIAAEHLLDDIGQVLHTRGCPSGCFGAGAM